MKRLWNWLLRRHKAEAEAAPEIAALAILPPPTESEPAAALTEAPAPADPSASSPVIVAAHL